MSRRPVDKEKRYAECLAALKTCSTRMEFYNTYPGQYHVLRSTEAGRAEMDAAFPKNDWSSTDRCIEEGKKYARRTDFRSQSPRAHDKLYHENNRALLEEVFPLAHITPKVVASAMLIKSMYENDREFSAKRPRVSALLKAHPSLYEQAQEWLNAHPDAKPIAW